MVLEGQLRQAGLDALAERRQNDAVEVVVSLGQQSQIEGERLASGGDAKEVWADWTSARAKGAPSLP